MFSAFFLQIVGCGIRSSLTGMQKRETIKKEEKNKPKQNQRQTCLGTGKRHKSKVIKYDNGVGQGLMSQTGAR